MNDNASTATCPASEAPKPAPILWGRIVSLIGAMGLCVSFFLPHFRLMFDSASGCCPFSVDAPVDLIGPDSLLPLARPSNLLIIPFMAAALLLPVLAFRASPRVDASRIAGGMLAWAQCGISLAVLVLSLAWMTWGIVSSASRQIPVPYTPYPILAEGFPVLVLTVIALIRSRPARKAAAALFALWSYYLAYFIYYELTTWFFYFGMWVSIVACGLLTLGAAIDWFQCRPALPEKEAMAQ